MQLIAFDNVKHQKTYQKKDGTLVKKLGIIDDWHQKLAIPDNVVTQTIDCLVPYSVKEDKVAAFRAKVAAVILPMIEQHQNWVLTASGNFRRTWRDDLTKKIEKQLAHEAIEAWLNTNDQVTVADIVEAIETNVPITKRWADDHTLAENVELTLRQLANTNQLLKMKAVESNATIYGKMTDHNYLTELKTVLQKDVALNKLIDTNDTVAELMQQLNDRIDAKL